MSIIVVVFAARTLSASRLSLTRARASLLGFFYFFNVMAAIALLFASVAAAFGVAFTLKPALDALASPSALVEHAYSCCGEPLRLSSTSFLGGGVAAAVVCAYVVTNHWALNNVLALGLVCVSVAFLRVPSLRIAAAVLGLLFVYDIFWVFYSERFFDENVMVSVATRHATNPLAALTPEAYRPAFLAQQLSLPMKITFGELMLGLGDMTIPGLALAYTRRFDEMMRARALASSVHAAALLGYAAGLAASFVAAFVYGHAQPALLYLVPGVLGGAYAGALTSLQPADVTALLDGTWDAHDSKKTDEDV